MTLQYWDSCVFIALLTNEDPKGSQVIRELVRDAEEGRSQIIISTLVVAEVKPLQSHDPQAGRVIDDLFSTYRRYLKTYALTRHIAQMARNIGGQFTHLTGADCVHVATALHAKADVMFTYDGVSAGGPRPRHLLYYSRKIGSPPLRIEVPSVSYGPLFDAGGQV